MKKNITIGVLGAILISIIVYNNNISLESKKQAQLADEYIELAKIRKKHAEEAVAEAKKMAAMAAKAEKEAEEAKSNCK